MRCSISWRRAMDRVTWICSSSDVEAATTKLRATDDLRRCMAEVEAKEAKAASENVSSAGSAAELPLRPNASSCRTP